MATNETINFIWEIVDANQEYNTKIILLFSLLAYSLIMFAFTFWIERKDDAWNENSKEFKLSRIILKRMFRWVGGSYIFVFLLLFLFMYREVQLETVLQIVYGLYIPFFSGLFIFGVMYSWDTVLLLTGLSKNSRVIGRRRRGKK